MPKPAEINLDQWIHDAFTGEWNIEDYFTDEEDNKSVKEKEELLKPDLNYIKLLHGVYYISKKPKINEIPIVKLSLEDTPQPLNSSGFFFFF